MGKFQFYHINEHYVSYLHSIDNRVQYNKGQRRPYVGVVLSINGVDYYVPLESPKDNHANIKGGGPVMKLDEGRLGVMGFNNMIPVLDSCLIKFDIQAVRDTKYKMLLLNQLEYCNKNRDLILQRAQTTYRRALSRKIPLYQKVCCNFEKLERKSKRYDPNYVPSKKKIHVTVPSEYFISRAPYQVLFFSIYNILNGDESYVHPPPSRICPHHPGGPAGRRADAEGIGGEA